MGGLGHPFGPGFVPVGQDEPAKIVIQQEGRWRWRVWIEHGLTRVERQYGTFAPTAERAENKGRKLLAWYEAQAAMRATRYEVKR